VGFVCSPRAILLASGRPAELPAGEFLALGQVVAPKIDLTVFTAAWFSKATRTHWASYDVMFGAGLGVSTEGELLANT
jgi:hypothetical protein